VQELSPGVGQTGVGHHGFHSGQGAGVDLQQVAALVAECRLHRLVHCLRPGGERKRLNFGVR